MEVRGARRHAARRGTAFLDGQIQSGMIVRLLQELAHGYAKTNTGGCP
jgi:hypothetical protein